MKIKNLTAGHCYHRYCSSLKEKQLFRRLALQPSVSVLDFSSNDYLGLSMNPQVITAAQHYASEWGVGGRSSRVLMKEPSPHRILEEMIAQTKNKDKALLFPAGFQANATVIAALLDKKVLGSDSLVFTDRLNHASLHHGCFCAQVQQLRYRHLDLDHLKNLLHKYRDDPRPKFLFTESLFGMDGDKVDMARLVSIAREYDVFLYIDDAHATGIFGERGYGLTEGFEEGIDLIMGTFSKALGASGGYVTGSAPLIDYLTNRCGGFIYSTTLSPMIVGAVHQAWTLLSTLDQERYRLLDLSEKVRYHLRALNYKTGRSESHIIPLIVGESERALAMEESLKKKNILVSAIRPPTVSHGTARLRLTLTAKHTEEDIDTLFQALEEL